MGRAPDLLTRLFRRATDRRGAEATTAELLGRFVATRDEEAFRALVDRHGPMVWGVCSRVLRQPQDIEDAFQATFIVLARRAAIVRPPELLPAWLHGVARRSALRVMRISARRREVQVSTMPNPAAAMINDLLDLPAVLDEELGRLPSKLRQAVVLCHLQSRTYSDAAREMKCSIAAVAKRLDRAAERLRGRLARRGLAPIGCTAWGLLAGAPEALAVPADVAARTTAAALGTVTGAAATGVAAATAREVATTVTRVPLRILATAVAVLIAGAGLAVVQRAAAPPVPKPVVAQSTEAVRLDRFGDPLPAGAVARLGTVRFRTGKAPCPGGVGFLADGKTLVSAHESGTIVFWDATTGKETDRIDGPPGAVSLVVSADGRRMVAVGTEMWAWDITPNGVKSLWKTPGSSKGELVATAALSPNGKVLAYGSRTGGQLIDADTGDLLQPLAVKATRVMAFSADGRALVVAGDGPVLLLDPATGKEQRRFDPKGSLTQLAVAPDGARVAAITGQMIRIWDAASGRELAGVPSAGNSSAALFFAPDGRTLLEAGGERIRYRDPGTGKESRPAVNAPHLQPHQSSFLFFYYNPVVPAVSPDGKRVAVIVGGGAVGVWRTDTGAEVGPSGGPHGEVTALAFTPNGNEILTAAAPDHFQAWNPATGAPGRRLATPAPGMTTRSLVVAPSGEVEAICAQTQFGGFRHLPGIVEWGARATGPGVDRHRVPAEVTKSKVWSPVTAAESADGRRVIWGTGTVLIVTDRATGAEVRRVDTKVAVTGVTVSADGETAAAFASKEGVVSVWDLGAARERMRVSARLNQSASCAPLALSADGRWLAGVEGGPKGAQAVQLWEVASNRVGPRFPVGAAAVLPLTFSPNGRLLAGGGREGKIRVWDLATGTEARQYTGHRGPVQALEFAPNGERLASGSTDATALVWDTRPLLAWPPLPARSWEATDAQWAGLGKDDPSQAVRTVWALVAAGDDAVPFLRTRLLRRPPPPSAERVTAVIKQLGSEEFAERERATDELAGLGIGAELALRAARTTDNPEIRARLDRLLARLAPTRAPELLAAVRGIAALERIGTPAAADALKEITAGRGHAVVTAEAEAAVRRVAARPKP
ncbi:wd-40 repeat : Uncultured bacterium genome assembly Metasoil_fosmids_resub OS=uncultured bacterium PE=4 SV=1: Sigma70_r2: Sigma70_r4_2: WD40: WD40 [Gemmata massiliana]|uniref:RNA polymerase sigma-70 region 2 domain-containing protein n=1 Tax=Gemmata massiliana TaxID=1210884 RepID=A0A6P2D4F7_9BACT|nr:sigma-70 family RNA polymerase sigma factor [Gemmata massiliana]VTR94984.1 wd-40 repeat : Uncultured bacterium genome assembly Metasoil_fosmids_resub OS=uncultured bacterium PE=4 SV=1: Sigma70_r2: Sigma70_r4_2: WD40: WD40 [Gemmata massiliana]